MNTKLTLNPMIMLILLTQLPATTTKAQSAKTDTGMINATIDANGDLQVRPSPSSSKNDFDFFIGDWNVAARKLKTRLHHSNEWLNFGATVTNTAILQGLGNTEPYYAKLNGKDFEGYTLRLFDPKTRLWSIYWADSNNGRMDPPQVGSFENNIGWFYAKDVWEGKNIIVVFKWDKTNPARPTWSQAFSADNGKTWEWNWYHVFERNMDKSKAPQLSENENIKVLELRNYILKPGKRDDFINYFEKHFIEPQNALGGYVLGQFRIKDTGNRFLWFRGFNDMDSRSAYLPEFYRKSLTWKKFGPGANKLLEDNDDVYLLRPLNTTGLNGQRTGISTSHFAGHKGIAVISYYTANESQLDTLISWYNHNYTPYLQTIGISGESLWISEMTPNDYPSLPVIQDKNLLVVIAFYKDEEEYRAKLKIDDHTRLQSQMNKLLKDKHTLIIYPTEKSFGESEN